MVGGRGFTFEIPLFLLEQIQRRSEVNGRSRNAEMRYLLDVGLGLAGDNDARVDLPDRKTTEWVARTVRLTHDQLEVVEERSARFGRSAGREVVRMMAFALEETTKRDLALIERMMSLPDRPAPRS